MALSGLMTSCLKCAQLDCGENGVCTEGVCVCDPGYFGENCDATTPCEANGFNCQNGGQCLDGSCLCPVNYYGTECETYCVNGFYNGDYCECHLGYEGDGCLDESRDKFIGTYSGNESCNTGNYSYEIAIQNGNNIVQLRIVGLYEVFAGPVWAELTDSVSFTIPYDEPDGNGVGISGSGQIDVANNQINMSYTISSGGNPDECTATFTRL